MLPPPYAEEPSAQFLLTKLAQKWEVEDQTINNLTQQAIFVLKKTAEEHILAIKDKLDHDIFELEIEKDRAVARQNINRAQQIDRVTSGHYNFMESAVEGGSWGSWFFNRFR